MTRSSRPKNGRSGPRGPIVLSEALARPRDRNFGGPAPDGPLPGRLLVALSRLHRAEAEAEPAKPPGRE